jgi:hypothetical protein
MAFLGRRLGRDRVDSRRWLGQRPESVVPPFESVIRALYIHPYAVRCVPSPIALATVESVGLSDDVGLDFRAGMATLNSPSSIGAKYDRRACPAVKVETRAKICLVGTRAIPRPP